MENSGALSISLDELNLVSLLDVLLFINAVN